MPSSAKYINSKVNVIKGWHLSESVTKHGDKEDRNGKKSVLAKATDITSEKEEMKEEAHDTENSKLKRISV